MRIKEKRPRHCHCNEFGDHWLTAKYTTHYKGCILASIKSQPCHYANLKTSNLSQEICLSSTENSYCIKDNKKQNIGT